VLASETPLVLTGGGDDRHRVVDHRARPQRRHDIDEHVHDLDVGLRQCILNQIYGGIAITGPNPLPDGAQGRRQPIDIAGLERGPQLVSVGARERRCDLVIRHRALRPFIHADEERLDDPFVDQGDDLEQRRSGRLDELARQDPRVCRARDM
jgi:hypothetical protein